MTKLDIVSLAVLRAVDKHEMVETYCLVEQMPKKMNGPDVPTSVIMMTLEDWDKLRATMKSLERLAKGDFGTVKPMAPLPDGQASLADQGDLYRLATRCFDQEYKNFHRRAFSGDQLRELIKLWFERGYVQGASDAPPLQGEYGE